MAIIFTIVFIGLDMFGANSMAIYVKAQMVENKVINSKAYQLAEAEAKNGTRIQNIYLKEMEEWRKAQRMHNFTCASLPKNYISKKIACKKEFYIKNPKPKKADIKSSGDVGFGDFTKMENEAKISLNHYDTYFYYAFFILSLLLNYLAVSSVFNQYRAKSKELSGDMIEVLRDRFETMQTEKLNKMRGSNFAIESKLKEFYDISIELEKEDYNLSISRRNNILKNRRNTINNIEYVETYPSAKAGKLDLVKQKKDERYIPKEDNIGNTEQYNNTDTIDLTAFDESELELVHLLFLNVSIGSQLNKRDIVLAKIGASKVNSNRLRDIYKKLLEMNYIYKKVAYFAKVTL
jgi:hypothetical protein